MESLDLSKIESAEALIRASLDRFGRIDRAAEHRRGRATNRSVRDDGRAMESRYGAETSRCTTRDRTCAESTERVEGSVVLTSGSAALDPRPAFAAVAATNAAINALAKAFAEHGIKDGAQVNSIVPGAGITGRRSHFSSTGRQHTIRLSKKRPNSSWKRRESAVTGVRKRSPACSPSWCRPQRNG